MIGFVFGLHHAFGRHVQSYSTLGRTVDNLFYVILGEFDYDELTQAHTRARARAHTHIHRQHI